VNARSRETVCSQHRLRIQADGAPADSVADQTLNNNWEAGRHAEAELLGRLECRGLRLKNAVLERVTWALLCWPTIEELLLFDLRSGGVVARLSRNLCRPKGSRREIYVWRDQWIEGQADLLPTSGNVDKVADFPPGGVQASGIVGRLKRWSGFKDLLDTGAAGVARRERIKLRAQRVIGVRLARLVQNGYQWSTHRLRQTRKAVRCPAKEYLSHLTEMYKPYHDNEVAVLIMVPRLDPGGAEKNIIELALRLSELGPRVHMMTTIASQNAWAEKLRGTKVELFHLPDFLPANCWFDFVRTFVSVRAVSHLHIMNSHWAYEYLPELKVRFPALTVITHLHAEGEPGTLDFPTLGARYDASIDVHCVISEHLMAYMRDRLRVRRQKIRVIRTGLESIEEVRGAGSGDSWRARHGVSSDTPIVIFVGRFSELKRPLLFVEIAVGVLQHCPDACFVLKGQGPLEYAIRQRLKATPSSVSHHVLIEDPTDPVADLMDAADLLVLPSLMEGIAYVSYEAMAQGLPQVYADVGGQSELLTPETGIAVNAGPEELAAYVDAVLMLIRDPVRRRSMGVAARSRIEEWPTAGDTAASFMKVYEEALQA